jgi:hypothetical protein
LNIFILRGLSNTELLLFSNCIGESIEALGLQDEFHTRVGVTAKEAEEVRYFLRGEISQRKIAGTWELR